MAMTRGSRTEVVDVIYTLIIIVMSTTSISATLLLLHHYDSRRGGCTYLPRSSFGDDNGDIVHGWYWRGLADGEGE